LLLSNTLATLGNAPMTAPGVEVVESRWLSRVDCSDSTHSAFAVQKAQLGAVLQKHFNHPLLASDGC
jgi:hypothetical protein